MTATLMENRFWSPPIEVVLLGDALAETATSLANYQSLIGAGYDIVHSPLSIVDIATNANSSHVVSHPISVLAQ